VFAVVVNYNGWADTLECLESLLDQDPHLRVIVLDNASTDGSLGRIEGWARRAGVMRCSELAFAQGAASLPQDVRVVLVACDRNHGFAGANNIALDYIRKNHPGGFGLLLNNDAVMGPDALRTMLRSFDAHSGTAAVGATVLRYEERDTVEMLGGATVSRLTGMVTPVGAGQRRDQSRPPSVPLDYVSGCCLLVPAATLERVGLMDERYFLYSEDVDWGLRMRRAGLRLVYCAAAEVWHKGGASVVHRSTVHDYYVVRGALMLVKKHFPGMLPIALVHWLIRGIMPKLLRREWRRLAAAIRGYRDFLMGVVGPASPTLA
jgi:GT2 family glycosyltransferase